jgi:hypothetical protein
MPWFQNLSRPPADPAAAGEEPCADQLLARAQEVRANGDLFTAQELAKQALQQGLRAHGERHPALVPFLLVYSGLLHQCLGWTAGRPFYDWAQRLRGSAPPLI